MMNNDTRILVSSIKILYAYNPKTWYITKVIGVSTGSPNTEKFDEQFQVMEEILGASNLEIKNYYKEKIAEKLAKYKE